MKGLLQHISYSSYSEPVGAIVNGNLPRYRLKHKSAAFVKPRFLL
ncbi:hypothetical protein [Pontibacter burrus]|nr:hypothetical protein [Pontibacter burrus]